MCYVYDMRKIFKQRARLVVYVESWQMDKMEKLARGSGLTLAEWTRQRLISSIMAERPVVVNGIKPEKLEGFGVLRTCIHGAAKGHHCWGCGGLAKIER